MDAVGVDRPGALRLRRRPAYDDIWGAQNAGLRAIHIPHSTIPADQVGHTEGEPDAVAHALAEVREHRARLVLSPGTFARLCNARTRSRGSAVHCRSV